MVDLGDDLPSLVPEGPELRYVVFADILGFKDIVRNNQHRHLVNIFSGDVRLMAEFGATGGITVPGQPAVPDRDIPIMNMRMISDSIILWTDSDRAPEFVWLLLAMRSMLKVGFGTGVPIRAALAHGELTHFVVDYGSPRLGSDTVIGRALVDAYEAESRQQWAGGVVLDAAIDRYQASISDGVPSIDALVEAGVLVRYDVPVKDGGAMSAFAVNWTTAFDDPLTVGLLDWSFTEYGKSIADDSVRRKFDNTVTFVSSLGRLADAAR